MRILHYIERVRLSVGGTVRAALDLCSGLAGAGHEVALMTLDASDAPSEWKRAEGPVRVMELEAGRAALGRLDGAQRARVREGLRWCEAAHIHAVWDVTNSQVASEARALGRAYVVSPHGMLDDWAMAQKRLKKLVYLRAAGGSRYLRGASALHFASASEAEQSPRWAPGVPCRTIPLLFDSSAYETLPGPERASARFGVSPGGEPILLFLSRLTPGKRADLVIGAAGELRRRGVGLRLVIAGEGDEQETARLRALASEAGVGGLTTWTGGVWGEEKISLYEAASVFMLPSDHENFCFALVEAMAAGTPVATVRTVGIWREVESSGGGVVCEASVSSLADGVEGWLRDASSRARASESARRWAMETLNMGRVASEYVGMYQDAAKAVRGG